MITSIFVNVPCPCGARHRLPAPPDGVIEWLCRGRVFTLRLQPAQFQRLLATSPSEQAVAAEGVCVLHTAAPPEGLQQRCEECGWLITSYRARVSHGLFVNHDQLRFWKPGTLVGRSIDGSWYRAQRPVSPHRERLCYAPATTLPPNINDIDAFRREYRREYIEPAVAFLRKPS